MDLSIAKYCNVVTYIENLYQGNLAPEQLATVATIPWSDWLQVWLRFLSNGSSQIPFKSGCNLNFANNLLPDCEIGLRLTGDRQIQILNRQYRSIDKATDVLAFAATEAEMIIPAESTEPLYLGDIIISLDTAAQQAQEQNHSLVTELAWLSSHGFLHLLGWDHPDEASLQQMLKQQAELIQLLSI